MFRGYTDENGVQSRSGSSSAHYKFDTHGRLRTSVYPTGLTARSGYNARGYLESLTDTANGSMLERYRAPSVVCCLSCWGRTECISEI